MSNTASDRNAGALLPEGRSPRGVGKLMTTAWIVYGSLGLLFLCFSDQVASRLDDFPSTAVVRGVQQGVLAVAAVSSRVGVGSFYRGARTRFFTAAGIGGS